MEVIKNKNKRNIAEVHFLTRQKEIKNEAVSKIIKGALLKCYNEISVLNKKIAIYSSKDTFIKNKMGGVGADTLQENQITLYINPTKGWKKELVNSIAHEYSHLAVLDVRKWSTVLDSLIIEGIAENFREEVMGGKRAPWTKALTKKESKDLLKKLRSKLKLKAEKLHHYLFFGSKEYKMWSGYTLGYFIVKEFRNKYPYMQWRDLVKLKSLEVLSKSGF